MSIYFVRHGQTDWNKKGFLQGQSDIPLNETGIQQAKNVKELMKDIKIDHVYCSPLLRTRETAAIINENWNLSIMEDEQLLERNFGEIEGKHKDAFDFKSFWIWDQERNFGMELMEEVFDRVYEFLDRIQEEAVDHNILIVAHGGVSIPFQCYFDEENKKKELISLILKNCEVAKRESKLNKECQKG